MNSSTIKESFNGLHEYHITSELLSKRKIFLQGEINAESANEFLVQLMYLESEGDEDINLYINSPGGEVTSGLLIYDLIQGAKSHINIYCTGLAASMAAIILASGEEGRRFIMPHSKVMIHEPLINGGVGGSATSIKNVSDSILKTKKLCNSILQKHTKKSLKEINKATSYDNYMSAKEAVDFGLCDSICQSL